MIFDLRNGGVFMAFMGMVFSTVFIIAYLLIWGFLGALSITLLIIGIVKRGKYKKLNVKRAYPVVLIVLSAVLLILPALPPAYYGIKTAAHEYRTDQNLFNCVVERNFEQAQRLIDGGASPDREANLNTESNEAAPDGEETLLLHFCLRKASDKGWSDAVKFLVDNGADINRREYVHDKDHPDHSGSNEYGFQWGDYCGRTPLMAAVWSGNIDSVRILLEAGADVNAVDFNGRSAYIWAGFTSGRSERAAIMALLEKYGAKTDVTDNFGQTVQDHIDYFDR